MDKHSLVPSFLLLCNCPRPLEHNNRNVNRFWKTNLDLFVYHDIAFSGYVHLQLFLKLNCIALF